MTKGCAGEFAQLTDLVLTGGPTPRSTRAGSASSSSPPVEVVRFIGAMREIGGGIIQRQRSTGGLERHIATLLSPARVMAVLSDLPEPGPEVRTVVRADEELEASVVVITSEGPMVDHRLDVLATQVAARCMVEELVGAAAAEQSP
jgi:hypothetical protein